MHTITKQNHFFAKSMLVVNVATTLPIVVMQSLVHLKVVIYLRRWDNV